MNFQRFFLYCIGHTWHLLFSEKQWLTKELATRNRLPHLMDGSRFFYELIMVTSREG